MESTKNLTSRKPRERHGMSGTPIYNAWLMIISRCYRTYSTAFASYGGRGITVCQEWQDSFVAFYDHVSMLPHFDKEGYTIDRIDNDGNYEPGNVRWATQKQQARNTRSNRMLTYKGKKQCVAAWAEELGIETNVLEQRLHNGWSVEKALAAPNQNDNSAHIIDPKELLRLMTCGLSYTDIARMKFTSISTIIKEADNLMQEVGVTNRVQLARYGLRTGAISLDQAWIISLKHTGEVVIRR